MKKIISLFLSVGLLSFSFIPALAVISAPDDLSTDQTQEQVRETTRVRVQEPTQNQTQLMQSRAAQVRSRYAYYENRMNVIAAKIQTKLNQLAKEGKNVSDAQQKLSLAMNKVKVSINQSREAVSKFEQINPEQFQEQRQMAQQAQGEIQQARTAMMEAKSLMKQAVESAKLAQ